MIEIYVLLSLVGLGYILSQEEPIKAKDSKLELSPADMPTSNNAYESTYAKQVAATERKAAVSAYNASLATAAAVEQGRLKDIPTPRVVNRAASLFQESKLAGVPIDFSHNNMLPFFKKHGAPRFDDNQNVARMEAYTGIQDVYVPKKEREPMFVPEAGRGLVNGMASHTDFAMSRVVKPRIQNNVAPVDKVYVGPGLNKGYSAEGVGGFHQFDARDYAMPKTTDQLRTFDNPKLSFKARTVDGKKPSQRGKVGELAQNRVPRVYEQTEDNLLRTTGAYLKNRERPCVDAKDTNRQDTTREYAGPAYAKGMGVKTGIGKSREPFKEQLGTPAIGAAAATRVGQGDKHDYGKANILVYANERDVTTLRTHKGNFTSLVKAIVAPIEDIFKTTKKETMVDNPRQFGELQPTFPAKGTVHDPTQTARTTIKETTLSAAEFMNLKGPNKATVHDSDNVARTTVKETTLSSADLMNLKGPIRATVYDPTDVARTTMKETLLQEGEIMNFAPVERRGAVHDPDVNARSTVRETLDPVQTNVNMRPGVAKKGTVHDPSNPLKTTVKETTLDYDYVGQQDRVDKQMGAYLDSNYEAPTTERELGLGEHFGQSDARAAGDAYQVTDMQARSTERELAGDVDYYGHAAAASGQKGHRSYEAEESIETDAGRELTLQGRAPTTQGAKIAVTTDDVGEVDVRKMPLEVEDRTANRDRVYQTRVDIDEMLETVTRGRHDYREDDRLDIELLNAFRDNPYTQPLNSAPAR